MKNLLRKLIAPILDPLEASEGEYDYQTTHRTFLKVLGFLFIGIASVSLYFSFKIEQWAGLLPVAIFAAIGLISLIVAAVGNDRAIAKIWRNRN